MKNIGIIGMNKEELIARARHRIEQKSQERHFSDETVLNVKRGYEIKCEQYESKIKELEAQIEIMKSCANCRYCINEEKCPWQPKGCGMKHWELKLRRKIND